MRSVWVWAAIVCLVLLFALSPSAAADREHDAGLVIDYGDGVMTYAVVPISEDAISGFDLLKKSDLPLVSVDFGGLGSGVCALDGQGCGVSECRRNLCQSKGSKSPFWKYFQLVDGSWSAQPLGASSSEVYPGSVDGWSWTSGEPDLPAVDLDTVVKMAGAPSADNGVASTTYRDGKTFSRASSNDQSRLRFLAGAGLILALVAMLLWQLANNRRGAKTSV